MMTLHGVDVFLRTPTVPDLPTEIGPFALKLISNRGNRVWPPPVPETTITDWQQCRYLSDSEVTDAQVDELVQKLGGLGYQWTKCQNTRSLLIFWAQRVPFFEQAA